jgi:hypothetical protein
MRRRTGTVLIEIELKADNEKLVLSTSDHVTLEGYVVADDELLGGRTIKTKRFATLLRGSTSYDVNLRHRRLADRIKRRVDLASFSLAITDDLLDMLMVLARTMTDKTCRITARCSGSGELQLGYRPGIKHLLLLDNACVIQKLPTSRFRRITDIEAGQSSERGSDCAEILRNYICSDRPCLELLRVCRAVSRARVAARCACS